MDAEDRWEVQIVHGPTNTYEVERRCRTRRDARRISSAAPAHSRHCVEYRSRRQ